MASILHFNPRAAIPMPAPEPKAQHTDQVHLADAVLCDECSMITARTEHARCRVCGSEAVISLQPILGPPSATARPQEVC